MQTALLKLTAKRTKDGLETINREVTPLPEEADMFFDRLVEMSAPRVLEEIRRGVKTVDGERKIQGARLYGQGVISTIQGRA